VPFLLHAMNDIIWCHQHRKLDGSHPHIADMIQSVNNPVSPKQGGEPEYIIRIRLESALEKIAGGECPFCGDPLMDKAAFDAWHRQVNIDHYGELTPDNQVIGGAKYCAECQQEHENVSIWGGIRMAPCGGRWRPLGLHPTNARDDRGKPVDISSDAEKLAAHHDKIRYGTIWKADGSPCHSESVEHGKKYHALVKGHPVVQ
jgi:hypothetical protein